MTLELGCDPYPPVRRNPARMARIAAAQMTSPRGRGAPSSHRVCFLQGLEEPGGGGGRQREQGGPLPVLKAAVRAEPTPVPAAAPPKRKTGAPQGRKGGKKQKIATKEFPKKDLPKLRSQRVAELEAEHRRASETSPAQAAVDEGGREQPLPAPPPPPAEELEERRGTVGGGAMAAAAAAAGGGEGQGAPPPSPPRAGGVTMEQEAAEAYLAEEVFKDSQVLAKHAKRITVMPKDLKLAVFFRQEGSRHTVPGQFEEQERSETIEEQERSETRQQGSEDEDHISFIMNKKGFAHEVLKNLPEPYTITAAAVLGLQEAAEAYLAEVFKASQVLAKHAKRITVMPEDLKLAVRMREPNKSLRWAPDTKKR